MVRMADVYEGMRPYLEDLDCITFASTPWVGDVRPLAKRRIAALVHRYQLRDSGRPQDSR